MDFKKSWPIVLIIIVVAFFVLPKLDFFSVTSPYITVSEDAEIDEDDRNYNNGNDYQMTLKSGASGTTQDPMRIYLKFRIPDEVINQVRAGATIEHAQIDLFIDAKNGALDAYIQKVSNSWTENSLTWNNAPASQGTITTIALNAPAGNWISLDYFSAYVQEKINNNEQYFSIMLRAVTEEDSESDYYKFITKDYSTRQPRLVITTSEQTSCVESAVIVANNEYKICHQGIYTPVSSLVLLTPAEQAAVMAQINALNQTLQDKARIIANLTSNIEGQANLINQLQVTQQEKAVIIQQLNSNLSYQAQLITAMQLTSQQQLVTIQALNLNINQQAQMINELQTNLNNKIYLISQLQVENVNQANLIRQMNLSFANQAAIINQLSSNVSSDAVIIRNLNLNVQDQARLITELRLERDQLASLLNSMNLSNSDTISLINNLNLRVNDQLAIIDSLNRSLSEEEDLIRSLRITIEQQNAIINQLRDTGQITIDEDQILAFWEQYKIFIILGGIALLAVLLLGGKRR